MNFSSCFVNFLGYFVWTIMSSSSLCFISFWRFEFLHHIISPQSEEFTVIILKCKSMLSSFSFTWNFLSLPSFLMDMFVGCRTVVWQCWFFFPSALYVVIFSSDLQNFWQEIIRYLNDFFFFCMSVMYHFPLAFENIFFLVFSILTIMSLPISCTPTPEFHWVSWFYKFYLLPDWEFFSHSFSEIF